jgi:hypothetical protein
MQKQRRREQGREPCRPPPADSQIHRNTVQKIEGLKSLPFCSGRIQYSKMTDPLTVALCKDLLRHVYTLQGTAFIESELAYYKAFEARRFPAAVAAPVATPAPAIVLHTVAPPPLPIRPNPVCTVKKEEVEVVEAPVPTVVPAVVVAEAAGGAGAAPAPAENKVIVAPAAEKTRYKRSELPDEERCIDVTARGTRCTLGRHEESEYCQRHLKKRSS